MYVKVSTGRYAGEVREFPFEVARDLIANGRAERVNYGGEPSVIQEPKAPPPNSKNDSKNDPKTKRTKKERRK